jgi:hypothetical protein
METRQCPLCWIRPEYGVIEHIFAGIIDGAKSKRALCWSASMKGP